MGESSSTPAIGTNIAPSPPPSYPQIFHEESLSSLPSGYNVYVICNYDDDELFYFAGQPSITTSIVPPPASYPQILPTGEELSSRPTINTKTIPPPPLYSQILHGESSSRSPIDHSRLVVANYEDGCQLYSTSQPSINTHISHSPASYPRMLPAKEELSSRPIINTDTFPPPLYSQILLEKLSSRLPTDQNGHVIPKYEDDSYFYSTNQVSINTNTTLLLASYPQILPTGESSSPRQSSPQNNNYVFPDDEHYFESFPPDYKFLPTDEELVVQYLTKKVLGQELPKNRISDVNIYDYDPMTLADTKKRCGEEEWYFFTPRDKKYPNGTRPNRAASGGYWKATGSDIPIKTKEDGTVVGYKKTLVFNLGKPPKGLKTNWLMHEYRVSESVQNIARTLPQNSSANSMLLDKWVLCKIYRRDEKGNYTSGGRDDGDGHGNDEEPALPPPYPAPPIDGYYSNYDEDNADLTNMLLGYSDDIKDGLDSIFK